MQRLFYLRLFCTGLLGPVLFIQASGQKTDDSDAGTSVQIDRTERSVVNFPTTFSSNTVSGSPWFSPVWIPGQVNFSDGHSLPLPGDVLYLNYDKSLHRLFFKKGDSVIAFRDTDIRDFQLNDSIGIHSFARVPGLTSSVFFEVLAESGTGFSLYRKMFSRLRPADYATVGYTSTGSKSSQYVDESQYYLLYPGGNKFFRFSLSRSGLRNKLARINNAAGKFMAEHPGVITHQLLLRLCEVLNENPGSP